MKTRTLRQMVHARPFRIGMLKVLGFIRWPGMVEESSQQRARRFLRIKRKQERQNRRHGSG